MRAILAGLLGRPTVDDAVDADDSPAHEPAEDDAAVPVRVPAAD